jgi:hypothetical protein
MQSESSTTQEPPTTPARPSATVSVASTTSTDTMTTITAPVAKTNKKDAAQQAAPVVYKPRRALLCCTLYKDRSSFQNILQELELSEVQKQIIRIRYLSILENYQRRARNYSYVYFTGHFIITVGSLLVPALLSIQNSDRNFTYSGDRFAAQIYWATFVISLLVTTFNGVFTLFKVDKKYYFLHTNLERLRSEGWQYFSLTGRYTTLKDKDRELPGTHINQFIHFIHLIEKIKMKQVQEEYYKADEKAMQAPGQNGNGQEGYSLSPDRPLNSMASQVPDPVQRAVNSIIVSQENIDVADRRDHVVVIPSPSAARERRNSQDTQASQASQATQATNNTDGPARGEEGRPYNGIRVII